MRKGVAKKPNETFESRMKQKGRDGRDDRKPDRNDGQRNGHATGTGWERLMLRWVGGV